MFNYKIGRQDKLYSNNCCANVRNADERLNVYILDFSNMKWATTLRDVFKLPMLIGKNGKITLRRRDYVCRRNLFATFTLLRYAEEHKSAVDKYYQVIKTVKGIDPLHAFYVACLRTGTADAGRGVMYFGQGKLPRPQTIDQLQKSMKLSNPSVVSIFDKGKYLDIKKYSNLMNTKTLTDRQFYTKYKALCK